MIAQTYEWTIAEQIEEIYFNQLRRRTTMQTAKISTTGVSQTVELPTEFRFDAQEVYIRRDEKTGEVILSPRPTWKSIFAMLDETEIPEDFLSAKERDQGLPQEREEL
jgi:antitoxin VapB